MPTTQPQAVVLGDINVDISLAVDRFPVEGGDAQAHGRTMGSGGGGLNAAVALRSLDVHVSLIGCVGVDPLADVALATARERGVDLSLLERSVEQPTGTCVLTTSQHGERTLLSHRGANLCLSEAPLAAVEFDHLRLCMTFGYGLLSSSQRTITTRLLELARTHNCVTAMDVGGAVARQPNLVLDVLPALDLVFVNQDELFALTSTDNLEKSLEHVLSGGVRTVVVKRGAKGCLVADDQVRAPYPGQYVDAVDTTACGDAFAAIFAWCWASSVQVEACARAANLIGARTASQRGAAESIPLRDASSELMNIVR